MPTTYSASGRFALPATGELNNTWGTVLNTGNFQLVDFAIAGWTTKALSGDYSLTTANGAADEARSAMLKFTGTGTFTVTVPAVSKRYDIWNACTGALTISNGSAIVTLQPGEKVGVITDGGANIARVQPTDFGGATLTSVSQISGLSAPTASNQAATKQYVDDASFAAASGSLPGQGGNAGKFLSTNGSTASWAAVVPLTRAISGGGLVTGGGTLAADLTLTVTNAAASDVRTGTSTATAMTPGDTYSALNEVTLTDAATIAVDMGAFLNAKVTLGGNRTLGNPTNPKVGQTGFIRLIQDGTGSRTLSFGGNWKRQGGAPVLTTTAGAIDVLEYQVITSTYILYNVLLNPS